MTYSSAVYDTDSDLSTAQTNKYRHLADLADIQPGDHVLEIGCGWGGFAKYAVEQRGARVTGITISKEQFDFASKRLSDAGLSDRTDVQLIDYRDLKGRFDKIVSIEMFEAVGQKYWATYFDALSSLLKDGGKAAIQSITISDEAFEEYRRELILFSVTSFQAACCRPCHVWRSLWQPLVCSLWKPTDLACITPGHLLNGVIASTKPGHHWRTVNLTTVSSGCGVSHLSYCEGGFRAGMIDVKQMLFVHK